MQAIDLRTIEEEFVFHFGGEFHRINAETFANSILELTGAIKEINRIANPNYDIEVYVDALGEGSFRARIKTITKKAGPLLDGVPKAIIVGLLTALIYDKIFTDNNDVNIIINDDSYVVEYGEKQIILPKEVAEIKQKVSADTEVERRLSGAFRALEKDPEIKDFGITKSMDDPEPLVIFPRSDFSVLSEVREVLISEDKSRIKDEKTSLLIIRAIFERGARKWQFVWRDGIKISAPVLDDTFFDKLRSHEYVIGTGDSISCLLRIYQARDEMSGVWVNETYEVIEVYNHTSGPRQTNIFGKRQD